MDIEFSPFNNTIYGFYKEGEMGEAIVFFKRMERNFPRAIDKTVRIITLCNDGEIEEAKSVFDQMVKEGCIPSAFVYAALIEAMCIENNLKEALNLINEMIQRHLFPMVATFNPLICAFCKEGEWMNASGLLE
jgi:pentatricopeptide repeat protein